MKTFVTVFLLLMSLTTNGQKERPWEQLLAGVMTAEDMESSTWDNTYEMLCELEQQPININTASREELEALPFLSAQQVEGIMEYLYQYGAMKSTNELRMIRSLDYAQIALLPYFTYIGEKNVKQDFPQLNDILKYGRQELMADVRVPFYKRKGDKAPTTGGSSSTEKGYLGYPYRHWLRYQFRYGDYVKAGLVGSQDAGEPFFSNKNTTGYDFYSYYLQLKHLGRLENMIIGKYKLSIGMGLVANNSFGLGKLAMLQQLGRNTNTVRPHSSRTQADWFQGAAATIRLSPQWLLTGFASHRAIDATLNTDSTARTIDSDGYHRTATEMEKKNNTHVTDVGGHIAFRQGGLHAGATALFTHLDRDLHPQTKTLYRRYNAQGNDFLNISADYGYLHHRFSLNGETAINRDGAIATINSLSLQAADRLNILLLQRFFSYRYTALYARTVTEGGHVQNESSLYLGATWQPSPHLYLQAYTDYAYFAWARYQVSQSSQAWDNLFSATYTRGCWSLTGRYRLHLRQKDDETKKALKDYTEQRGRLALNWQGGNLTCTTQADVASSNLNGNETGYMLSEVFGYRHRTWKVSATAGYFHTDSYACRLYVYENSPLYSFSFPAYYGEGMRLALMMQATVMQRLTLTAKVSHTRYFDRSTIGSGLQEIDSHETTDLDLQVRWKF